MTSHISYIVTFITAIMITFFILKIDKKFPKFIDFIIVQNKKIKDNPNRFINTLAIYNIHETVAWFLLLLIPYFNLIMVSVIVLYILIVLIMAKLLPFLVSIVLKYRERFGLFE